MLLGQQEESPCSTARAALQGSQLMEEHAFQPLSHTQNKLLVECSFGVSFKNL